ncbi:MAG: DsrE family protein [Dehalococcoidia bacterium]|nr:DsrE family protein [Dehalococcoidia bacterium]
MENKKVAVVIRYSPLGSVRSAEALRMSVGLTLADNDITVLLVDDAAWLTTALSPERIGGGDIKKPIDTLHLLKAPIWVEKESLASRGIADDEVSAGVEIVSASAIARYIATAQATVVF